jgi:hypothetical protein
MFFEELFIISGGLEPAIGYTVYIETKSYFLQIFPTF